VNVIQIYITDFDDTIRTISKKTDIDMEEIIALNSEMTNPDQCLSGRAIKLPSAARQGTEKLQVPECPPSQPLNSLHHWIPLTPLEEMEKGDYDVLIVGTGAGGSSVLRRLCDKWGHTHKRIGIIEKGNLMLQTHARNLATMNTDRLNRYFDTVSTPIGKSLPMLSGARVLNALGGKTLFWGLVTPRMPVSKSWPVEEKEMDYYYKIAEQTMDVTNEYFKRSTIQSILLQRVQNSGYDDAINFPLAVDLQPTTFGVITSNVNWSSIAFLAYALNRKSFDLAVNAQAVQILVENGKTAGVKVMSPDKKTYFLKAKYVVLSAGTFDTTKILLNSGIQGRAIGHYLLDPSTVGAAGKFNRREFPETLGPLGIIVPQTKKRPYQIQIGGPFGIEGDYFWQQPYEVPPHLEEELMVGLSGYGRIEPRFENRIYLDPHKKDKFGYPDIQVSFSYSEKDKEIINQMSTEIERLSKIMHTTIDMKNGKPDICMNPPGSAFHTGGTCRMGDNPLTSATNRYGQVHHVPGLFVADNSLLPAIGVNPLLTTVALSIRTADYIVKDLD
jgi:choline dehydrogenase-like flavoprotein